MRTVCQTFLLGWVVSGFLAGIATGLATFETAVPEWHSWDQAHMQSCRLVAQEGNTLIVPSNLTDIASMISLATTIAKKDPPGPASNT